MDSAPQLTAVAMRTIAAATFVVLSSPVMAQFHDGHFMREACKVDLNGTYAFATGVIDAAYIYQSLKGVKDRICLPENLNSTQVGDVACKYIEENPADRHMLAADLVLEAAAAAWPCK